jgi:hypothetical protein
MEILTANSLGDGRVVFRTATGWSTRIDEAEVLASKEAVAAAVALAEADAAANKVVEPYAVAVALDGGHLVPSKLRERIRATGPTAGNSKAA